MKKTFLLMIVTLATMHATAQAGKITTHSRLSKELADKVAATRNLPRLMFIPQITDPAKNAMVNIFYPVTVSGRGKAACILYFQAIWTWQNADKSYGSKDYWTSTKVNADNTFTIPQFKIDFPQNYDKPRLWFWCYQHDDVAKRSSDNFLQEYKVISRNMLGKVPPQIDKPVKVLPKDKQALRP